MLDQFRERSHGVVDVTKTARLLAIAENRQRLARERRAYEVGQYHAVSAGLAWADGIEQAHDHHRQTFFLPVGEREKLVDGLRAGIAPAPLLRATHHQIVFLGKGDLGRLAVNFRGAGDQHFLFLLAGKFQHRFGALDVVLDRSHRTLDDQPHADGSRQVKYRVGVIDQLRQQMTIENRFDDIVKTAPDFQPLDILNRAGAEVVDHGHRMSCAQEFFGEMAADKTRPAGNQIMHLKLSFLDKISQPANSVQASLTEE